MKNEIFHQKFIKNGFPEKNSYFIILGYPHIGRLVLGDKRTWKFPNGVVDFWRRQALSSGQCVEADKGEKDKHEADSITNTQGIHMIEHFNSKQQKIYAF